MLDSQSSQTLLQRPSRRSGLGHSGLRRSDLGAGYVLLVCASILAAVACKRPSAGTDALDTANTQAQNAATARGAAQTLPASALPASALQLQAPRALAGTGIEVALPKGAVRAGRTLTFKVPGRSALFALSHTRSGSPPMVAVKQASKVYGLKQEFAATSEPFELSQTPERFAIMGDMSENVLGDRATGLAGLIAARNEADHLFFLRSSFEPAERPLVEAVAKTINILPEAPLEPLQVHGLQMQVAEGYELKPGQLNPIVVLPKGAAHVSGEPNLDLRITDAGHVAELFDDIVGKFKADPSLVKCDADVTQDPSGTNAKYRHQTCRFPSGQGPYLVRTDAFEGSNGGLVAITTQPDPDVGHSEAFAQMLSTLRLGTVPEL